MRDPEIIVVHPFADRQVFKCMWPGCSEDIAPSSAQRRPQLCAAHRVEKRHLDRGDTTISGVRLTDEQIAELRRRMGRLENPKTIMRDLGISYTTLMRMMKR